MNISLLTQTHLVAKTKKESKSVKTKIKENLPQWILLVSILFIFLLCQLFISIKFDYLGFVGISTLGLLTFFYFLMFYVKNQMALYITMGVLLLLYMTIFILIVLKIKDDATLVGEINNSNALNALFPSLFLPSCILIVCAIFFEGRKTLAWFGLINMVLFMMVFINLLIQRHTTRNTTVSQNVANNTNMPEYLFLQQITSQPNFQSGLRK